MYYFVHPAEMIEIYIYRKGHRKEMVTSDVNCTSAKEGRTKGVKTGIKDFLQKTSLFGPNYSRIIWPG